MGQRVPLPPWATRQDWERRLRYYELLVAIQVVSLVTAIALVCLFVYLDRFGPVWTGSARTGPAGQASEEKAFSGKVDRWTGSLARAEGRAHARAYAREDLTGPSGPVVQRSREGEGGGFAGGPFADGT